MDINIKEIALNRGKTSFKIGIYCKMRDHHAIIDQVIEKEKRNQSKIF